MQESARLGPLLLYSTTPSPAEATAVRLAANHAGRSKAIKVVVLQTPMRERSESLVSDLHNMFSGHGVNLETTDPQIQEREDAFSALAVESIRRANLILVAGGDPARMVRVIQNSPALNALRAASADGAVIAGCSAGAMIFGEGFLDGPRDNPRPTALLGWLRNLIIAPHFGAYPIEPWQSAWPDKSILCLPDESIVMITSNGTELRSLGRVPAQLLDSSSGTFQSVPTDEPQQLHPTVPET